MKVLRSRGETLTLATTVGFPQSLGIPPGFNYVEIEVPSATKENISLGLCPKLTDIWFFDNSATTQYIRLTEALTDRNAAVTSGTTLDAMQAADFLYVGADRQFRGVAVDVANTNSAGTATMAVTYWNGTAWTNITPTDGTLATRTLAQDGLVTWTVPTDWARTTLTLNRSDQVTMLRYWVRIAVSADLTDTSVSIAQLNALLNTVVSSTTSDYESTDYILLQSNAQSIPPYRYALSTNEHGAIEMKSASITSAANINWLYCVEDY